MATENWLEELDIDEVSLVYDPMNPESVISIMKSKPVAKGAGRGSLDITRPLSRVTAVIKEAHARRLSHGVLREVFDNFGALRDNLDATMSDSSLTTVQKAKNISSIFDEYRESLDKLAPEAVISKSVADAMASITKGDDPAVILRELSMNADQIAAALATADSTIAQQADEIATLTKGRDALSAEVSVLKSKVPGASDEDQYAGMPPVVIAKMKAMEATVAIQAAAIAKGEDDAAIRVKADFFKGKLVPQFDTVAAAFYRVSKSKGLPARVEKGADGKDVNIASDVDVIEQALVAKASAAKVSLKVIGSSAVAKGNEGDDIVDAEAELKEKAAVIAKGKNISEAAAYSQAMNENPDLYEAYRKQQRHKAANI